MVHKSSFGEIFKIKGNTAGLNMHSRCRLKKNKHLDLICSRKKKQVIKFDKLHHLSDKAKFYVSLARCAPRQGRNPESPKDKKMGTHGKLPVSQAGSDREEGATCWEEFANQRRHDPSKKGGHCNQF
ncbi:MAG: hypothetical protein FWF31_03300 [Desulfobulbus sp.]|nr:hypothetical protein [Desulfobulbus sp.]